MRATAVLLACALCYTVTGYPYFRDLFPNGQNVPHPCENNATWAGVGHYSVGGGGARNVFGVDFHAAGNQWTRELCLKDSDGDGRTNGQELGDPQCTWTPGATPQVTTGITHPGVCEPVNSVSCSSRAVSSTTYTSQKDWTDDVCGKSSRFICPQLDSAQNVQQIDLRIPTTSVPAKETTYICSTFEFPDVSRDYHVIASTPVINNTNVMHHMLLFGCVDDAELHGPREQCNMGQCSSLLVGWAVGQVGSCFHQDAGIRMGKTGFKRMLIQYHWNNPQEIANYKDSSGMTLFYTPTLRDNDLAMLMIGQTWLAIPPASPDSVYTSECSSACTSSLMAGDIQVTQAFNHMHLTGVGQSIEHLRDGQHLRYFTNENDFHYDSPKFFDYDTPITIKPGDVLRTICHFATPGKNRTIFYGDGTQDEMCYGFLTFFPVQNMPRHECVTWKSLSMQGCDAAAWQGCDIARYTNETSFVQSQLYTGVMTVCDPFGPCTTECKAGLKYAMQHEPCMRFEDTWTALKWGTLKNTVPGKQFLAAIESCATDIAVENVRAASPSGPNAPVSNVDNDTGAGHMTAPITMATVGVVTLSLLLS